MAAVTICSNIGDQENKVCHCFHCFPIYLPWNGGTGCHDLCFWMLTFKPAFSFCYSSHLAYKILLWQPELRNHLSGRISIPDQFNCLLFSYAHLIELLSKSWDVQIIGDTVCFYLLPCLGALAVRMGKNSENFDSFLLSSKFCLNFPLTLTHSRELCLLLRWRKLERNM